MSKLSAAIKNPRQLIVLLMGFSSGLPLLLVGSTLKAWLTESGIDIKTIGFFALVALPYAYKVLWSPVMDRFVPLRLGRRRSWLLISQIGLVLSLLALSNVDPKTQLTLVAAFSVLVAFCSASQDIVVDAYRREILSEDELALGSSLYVIGYRIAILVAGAGALFTADHLTWSQTYVVMAALMSVGLLTTLLCPEPKVSVPPPKSLRDSVVGPLKDFFQRDGALTILAFVVFYKVGESMASELYTTFFIKQGFSKTEIAVVAKSFGIWAMILGSLAGGAITLRLKLYRSLWFFGILQSVSLLLFSLLAVLGQNHVMLACAIIVENFTSGMATSAFTAFMASQTNKRFTATQYSLMTSLMKVQIYFNALTGVMQAYLGWPLFFAACMVMTIPGLLILFRARRLIEIVH